MPAVVRALIAAWLDGDGAYVVKVSALEGVFHRGYRGPHTTMAKAALEMLPRTSAREIFETDRILMTAPC